MKKFQMILSVLSLSLSSPSWAGNEGSGGGSTIRSTESAVEFEFYGAFQNVNVLVRSPESIFFDQRARQIMEQIHTSIRLEALADGSNYQWIEGPCSTLDAEHMGSAVMGDPHTPICLSTTEFQRLPDDGTLFMQMIGLMVHELAHQAGYAEDDAQHLQNQVLRLYEFRERGRVVGNLAINAQIAFDRARNAWARASSSLAERCFNIGNLQAELHALENEHRPPRWLETRSIDQINEEYRIRHSARRQEAEQLEVYCRTEVGATEIEAMTRKAGATIQEIRTYWERGRF